MWGGGITLLSLALGAGLIYKALQMDVRLEQLFPFVVGSFFLALGAVYAYWTWGCNSLSYMVDRNALFSFPVYRELNIAQMVAALRRILDETKDWREPAATPPPVVAS